MLFIKNLKAPELQKFFIPVSIDYSLIFQQECSYNPELCDVFSFALTLLNLFGEISSVILWIDEENTN